MPSTKPTYLTISTSPSSPPSETEIYSIAKVAHSKLVSEAALKDQNLRRLVGHANLYDKLLDEYNNCFSDSESDFDFDIDTDTESFDDDDVEEFATQAYYATPVTTYSTATGKLGGRTEVEIHEASTYIYQDRDQERERQLVAGSEAEIGGTVLCKVASHSENLNLGFHYAEVEVKELEVFDE